MRGLCISTLSLLYDCTPAYSFPVNHPHAHRSGVRSPAECQCLRPRGVCIINFTFIRLMLAAGEYLDVFMRVWHFVRVSRGKSITTVRFFYGQDNVTVCPYGFCSASPHSGTRAHRESSMVLLFTTLKEHSYVQKKKYSGAHSRVATLIQPSFHKKENGDCTAEATTPTIYQKNI